MLKPRRPAILDKWSDLWSPPNLATYARLLLTWPATLYVLAPTVELAWLGFACFVIAAASDKLDGWLAKRNNRRWATRWGMFLDPIVDKVLVLSVLVAIISRVDGAIRPLIVSALVIIAVREVIVGAVKAGQTLKSAAEAGRVSMLLQSAAVGLLTLPSVGPWQQGSMLAIWVLYASVGASACSGLLYGIERYLARMGRTTHWGVAYLFAVGLGMASAIAVLAADGDLSDELTLSLVAATAGAVICALWSDAAEFRKQMKEVKL